MNVDAELSIVGNTKDLKTNNKKLDDKCPTCKSTYII